MPFLADRLARVKASPTMAITALATELKAAGRDIISLSVGRARFRHAGEHQGGGDRRDPPRRHQIHRVRRPDGAEAGDLRQVQARERARLRAGQITVSSGGKQVLYNALVATLSPGDEVVIPAPYLGVVPGDGAARRRQPGAGRLPAEQRVQAAARGPRRRDHAQDQVADPQFAVEPDRRGLYRGRSARGRRRAAQSTRMSG